MSCWIHWLKKYIIKVPTCSLPSCNISPSAPIQPQIPSPSSTSAAKAEQDIHWGDGILGIPVLPDAFWYLNSQTNNHLWAGTTSRLSTVMGQQLFLDRSIYFISDVRSLCIWRVKGKIPMVGYKRLVMF